MKKIKLIVFFMLLGMSILFLIPLKVSASINPDLTAGEWYNHITQFNYGFSSSNVYESESTDDNFYLLITNEPTGDVEGIIEYDVNEDLIYFEPRLRQVIEIWVNGGFAYDLAYLLYYEYGIEEFDGSLYWNFQKKYWQIDYYMTSEIDYYIQRIDYLENLVANLNNDLYLKGIEIYSLQMEIQNLEDALDLEFDRGYDDGYDVGYDEGYGKGILEGDYAEAYEAGFKAGEKSKLAENNEAFYTGIEKWLVPAVITVIVLGGIVSIAAIRRREQ